MAGDDEDARAAAETAARRSYGRLVAYLSARTRDVAGAEDALADAFAAALESWPRSGVPANPEAWLLSVATLIDEVPELLAVPNDPKDNMVIATAVAGKADYLVTGDRKHLLPMKAYQGICILSPHSFLDLLESEQGAKAA